MNMWSLKDRLGQSFAHLERTYTDKVNAKTAHDLRGQERTEKSLGRIRNEIDKKESRQEQMLRRKIEEEQKSEILEIKSKIETLLKITQDKEKAQLDSKRSNEYLEYLERMSSSSSLSPCEAYNDSSDTTSSCAPNQIPNSNIEISRALQSAYAASASSSTQMNTFMRPNGATQAQSSTSLSFQSKPNSSQSQRSQPKSNTSHSQPKSNASQSQSKSNASHSQSKPKSTGLLDSLKEKLSICSLLQSPFEGSKKTSENTEAKPEPSATLMTQDMPMSLRTSKANKAKRVAVLGGRIPANTETSAQTGQAETTSLPNTSLTSNAYQFSDPSSPSSSSTGSPQMDRSGLPRAPSIEALENMLGKEPGHGSTNQDLNVNEMLALIKKQGTIEDDERLYEMITKTIDKMKKRHDFEAIKTSMQLDIARKYIKDFINLRLALQKNPPKTDSNSPTKPSKKPESGIYKATK
ncbi:hypothetical protein NEHOM01_1479 [Nematocida homosporus]|uniref:uncharacterized protein n=1 Tax=Nematocida homosporus TaxID=1912981 RepID=UPI00221E99B7|nr:uncharacterized protein NEHOM01_1479 [Nematocida homosporus]KAI5186446.1 hypothetical protein NEHOM01_1479 [Nematocida homosporus]